MKRSLKHIYCSAKSCYRIVKKKGNFCKVHQGMQDQVEAGIVETPDSNAIAGEVAVVEEATATSPAREEFVQGDGNHLAGPGKLIESCGDCSSDGDCAIIAKTGHCMCEGDHKPADLEISPETVEAPPEATDPCAKPESPAEDGKAAAEATEAVAGRGLSALLREPAPAPIGMFIPFAPEELAALVEVEVTPEVIREFVIMGLEGKLQAI